jgi:hypothetical protein
MSTPVIPPGVRPLRLLPDDHRRRAGGSRTNLGGKPRILGGGVYMDAVRAGIAEAMRENDDVLMAGIDVGSGGGIFGVRRGLKEEFGDRIRDTPISESALVGLEIGASIRGFRPIVEIMFIG